MGLGRVGWWASANATADTNELSHLFDDWYPPVLELIEATPASSILKAGAFDRAPTRNWGHGRITMLGDAIHPTTPRVEDWEQFFVEKSRRRFEKERLERRRLRQQGLIAAAIIGAIVLAAILGLALLK